MLAQKVTVLPEVIDVLIRFWPDCQVVINICTYTLIAWGGWMGHTVFSRFCVHVHFNYVYNVNQRTNGQSCKRSPEICCIYEYTSALSTYVDLAVK